MLEELKCLIVEDAAEIYLCNMVTLLHLQRETRTFSKPEKMKEACLDNIWDVEQFFCSEYGEAITGYSGKTVLDALNHRVEEEYQKTLTDKKRYRNLRGCHRFEREGGYRVRGM